MKSDLDIHDEVAAGFGRWRDLFERGLAAMRERGERAVTTPGEAGGT
jgi:TetR/AcrR family transcriptional regulator, transcriptional repressor for nem operon